MYQEARDVSEGGGCRHEDGHRPVTPVTHAVIEVPAGGEGAGLRPPPAGNQDGSSLGPGPGTCPLRKDITVPLVISQACSGLRWAPGHAKGTKKKTNPHRPNNSTAQTVADTSSSGLSPCVYLFVQTAKLAPAAYGVVVRVWAGEGGARRFKSPF